MQAEKKNLSPYDVKNNIIILLMFLAVSALFVYATRCGINRTFDSGIYIQRADDIGGRTANTVPGDEVYFHWPPLFSLIIFLFNLKLGMGFGLMQYFFLALNIFLLLLIGNKTLNPARLKIAWLAMTSAGVSFLMIHVFLWSEALFVMMISGTVLLLDRYLKKEKIPTFILLILLSCLLCLQRNAGILIVLAISISILWFVPGKKGVIKSLIYLLAASSGFILWNFYYSGGKEIQLQSLFSGFGHNILVYLNVISAWLLPRIIIPELRITCLLVMLLFVVFTRTYRRYYRDPSGIIIFLIIIYFIGISSLGPIDLFESERYLSVIYPGMMLLIFKSFSIYWHRVRLSVRILMACILVIWFSYTVLRTYINAERWHGASCRATALHNVQNTKMPFYVSVNDINLNTFKTKKKFNGIII